MALRVLCCHLAWLAAAATAPAAAEPLDAAQRAAVLEAAGLKPRDGGTFAIEGCASVLKPQLESIALEAGRPAGVLVYLGPSRCFAETQGGNVALLAVDANGRWSMPMAFVPGVEVVRQPTSNAGWPDLGVANPGGCMPVYRHDGTRYARIGQKALQPGGCQFRE
ncbi:MAG TPA: hypothetical protein VFR90_06985 [Methylibium sp.]|uniref:hypothetical protein n=1 Tax=Methylibium sp. TaxID=2067992 RepID=UPI002DBE81F2|nr:hypothetical protein [Methylibium sp.]HEU4458851.1 hypothetical protein [Methylibium sp.]